MKCSFGISDFLLLLSYKCCHVCLKKNLLVFGLELCWLHRSISRELSSKKYLVFLSVNMLSMTLHLLLLLCCSVMSDSLQPHRLQHTSLPCPSLFPGVCLNSCPLSQWCHPTISSSVAPFSCPHSFPESGSFPMSQLFTSGGHSIGTSASVLPVNIQGWFPLGLTGLIYLLFKGLSRVFSSTVVQNHQFFSAQSCLWYNSHIHTWLQEKP